jgi:hypothetical protein
MPNTAMVCWNNSKACKLSQADQYRQTNGKACQLSNA